MCGICGQYNFGSRAPVDRDGVIRMTRTLVHRGPDDEGFYFSGPLGLGFRRLSIIDLDGGHQPMSDKEESVWIVFNGEIYNYPELRRELEEQGHSFRTRSDTEVIIHGYKEWDLRVFNHLNGMFGLAIWDVRRRRLVLARDAMGIKLLYYRLTEGAVQFGSEIRAIKAANPDTPSVDPIALYLFLRYRFTPSPHTPYRGIRKLAAGTMLVAEDGHARVRRWYDFKPEPFAPMPSDGEAGEELRHIYQRAVKRHLLSDVPVGLMLSGGVDSGLLLALMNLQGHAWPTFTVGYGSSFKDDELRLAAETAGLFSAKNASVQLDRETFNEYLPRIVSCLEEPVAASSIVPMYFVSRRAREEVKVALNGQGPDELFGGYRRHLGVRYAGIWAGLPDWLRLPATRAINLLPRNETLKRGAHSLNEHNRLRRFQQVLSLLPGDRIDTLFHRGLLPPDPGDTILDCWQDLIPLMEHTDDMGAFQFLEVRSTLPDELLLYADKLSMAHSLEVRVPYLDREIVEYVERLNCSFKIRYGSRKWLHRRVCRRFLPGKVLHRKKRGFAVNVVDGWFRPSRGHASPLFPDRDSPLFSYLDYSSVRRMEQDHRTGLRDNHKLLFSMVVANEWMSCTFQ